MATYVLSKLVQKPKPSGRKKREPAEWEKMDECTAPSRRQAVGLFEVRYKHLRPHTNLETAENGNLIAVKDPGLFGQWKVREKEE